jgi:hypothetical protein
MMAVLTKAASNALLCGFTVAIVSFGGLGLSGIEIQAAILVAAIAAGLSAVQACVPNLLTTSQPQTEDSPQARFARDEISMLELEQEIERQLKMGESGMEMMEPPTILSKLTLINGAYHGGWRFDGCKWCSQAGTKITTH